MPFHSTAEPSPIGRPFSSQSNRDQAELAAPASWPSTGGTALGSASSNATHVGKEDLDAASSLAPSRFGFFIVYNFCLRFLTAIFCRMSSWHNEYVARKEEERVKLQTFYADIKTKRESIEEYPLGWPQLAAFLHSEDNFAIFRRFGMVHCRVLVQLQAEIQQLERKLIELDRSDAAPNSPHSWRLQMIDFEEGWDPSQRDLLTQLQEKLLVYDQLLLNDQNLRNLGQAPKKDHLSFYHWIIDRKPLGKGQYGWIYEAHDFVSLVKFDQFENSILTSFLKRLFRTSNNEENTIVHHYSLTSVSAVAKLLNVLLAVGILIIPVFILLWIPETRAWISATVLISVLVFSTLMSLFTKSRVQDILVGTAAYCAVLATFLGNTQQANSGGKVAA